MSLFIRRLRSGRIVYCSRLPHPVRKKRYVRKSMKTSSKRKAQSNERKWQQTLYSGELFAATEPEPMFFEKLCVQYLDHGKPGNRPQTKRRDRTSIKNLLRYFGGMTLQQITKQNVERYMTARLKEYVPNRKNVEPKKVNTRTVNIEVTTLNSMLNKAVDWGHLRVNSVKGIRKLPVDPRPPMILSEAEEALLMDYLPHYQQPIVKFVLNTGLRLQETLKLQWGYIYWEQRMLIFGRDVKKRRIRRVPLNNTAIQILRAYKLFADMRTKNKEFVFVKSDGTSFGNIIKGFKAACRKAGIPGFRIHDLRATFSVRFLSRPGNNIRELQMILGHKSITTTAIYLQYVDSYLVEAVKRMDGDTKMTHEVSRKDKERGEC